MLPAEYCAIASKMDRGIRDCLCFDRGKLIPSVLRDEHVAAADSLGPCLALGPSSCKYLLDIHLG